MVANNDYCQWCEKEIESKYRGQKRKYCSSSCRSKAWKKKVYYENSMFDEGVSTSNVGATNELVVSVDLLRRGHLVFRNVAPNGDCDIVCLKNGQVIRIEVRTKSFNQDGSISISNERNKFSGQYDILACVTHSGSILYFDANNNFDKLELAIGG